MKGCRGKKYKVGGRKTVGLKTRVVWSRVVQMDQVEQWNYTNWRRPKKNTVLVGVRSPKEAGRTAPGVRAA